MKFQKKKKFTYSINLLESNSPSKQSDSLRIQKNEHAVTTNPTLAYTPKVTKDL